MKLKRLIYLIVGFISLALGCIGIALPILPTVPFLLLTAFCFANSSERLHTWFLGTKLYKKHLESFVQKKGMTKQTKWGIIIPVTILMGIGFALMLRKDLYVPCGILAFVWLAHIVYFGFGVKTITPEEAAALAAENAAGESEKIAQDEEAS